EDLDGGGCDAGHSVDVGPDAVPADQADDRVVRELPGAVLVDGPGAGRRGPQLLVGRFGHGRRVPRRVGGRESLGQPAAGGHRRAATMDGLAPTSGSWDNPLNV